VKKLTLQLVLSKPISLLERIFELIALELDGGTLGGETWHTELLRPIRSHSHEVAAHRMIC